MKDLSLWHHFIFVVVVLLIICFGAPILNDWIGESNQIAVPLIDQKSIKQDLEEIKRGMALLNAQVAGINKNLNHIGIFYNVKVEQKK